MAPRKLDRDRLGIYCWFFSLFTVLSLAGVVAWLSLTPKNPIFRISDARFPALDSKNHSTHTNVSVPNKSLIFDLEIFNPNKRMGIYYSAISLELCSGHGGVVGRNSTPAFYQGHKNTILFQILINANQEFQQTLNGENLNFIRVKTAFMFRIIKWKTKLRQIAYEEHFTKEKLNLNGTVSRESYAEQQNASKVKIRT